MAKASRWTDFMGTEMRVLDYANELIIEHFATADLDQLPGSHVKSLRLKHAKQSEPLDLRRLLQVKDLESLELEKVSLAHLESLADLPELRHLVIADCPLNDIGFLDGLTSLSSLVLRHCGLQSFPDTLHLPALRYLALTDNAISDLRFVAAYPELVNLSIDSNTIKDVSALASCRQLEVLSLRYNPVANLAPLQALDRLWRFEIESARAKEARALNLGDPERRPRRRPQPDKVEMETLRKYIITGDWRALNAYQGDPVARRNAVFDFVDNQRGKNWQAACRPSLKIVLENVDEPILGDFICRCLGSLFSRLIDFFHEVFASLERPLLGPLTYAFDAALANDGDYSYGPGHLGRVHHQIAQLLRKVAAAELTPLYMRFLAQRESFSFWHLLTYKELLHSVGKSKAQELVAPLIDLLRYDSRILGGDAVFVKRCLAAIKSLGTRSDIPALEAAFDGMNDPRADVAKAYRETVARLQKKQARKVAIEDSEPEPILDPEELPADDELCAHAANGNVDRVKDALARGAPVETRDSGGNTMLIRAAREGQLEIVRMLLDAGADPNSRGQEGETALLGCRSLAVMRALIAAGADPFQRGDDFETPLGRIEEELASLNAMQEALDAGEMPGYQGPFWPPSEEMIAMRDLLRSFHEVNEHAA